MALTNEWRGRINRWRDELKRHFYRPLGSVDISGYVTERRLSAAEAAAGPFEPMPSGTRWGGKWEYGWFRGSITLPPEADGERIVFRFCMREGGEGTLVHLNGRVLGERDVLHDGGLITLARCGEAGAVCDLLLECYAGHGPRVCGVGPVPPGRVTVPEPPPTQAVMGESTYGVWQEDVYQLWIDVETLYELRENIDSMSLRVAQIDAGLRDFTNIVDFECPRERMLATIAAAHKRLAPLLACVNGSTAPTLYAFGHGHIDVAWLWPLAETERKCARTLGNQLALAEEYPWFKFLQSQPHLYAMVRRCYPELYERVKQAVRDGGIIAEGGMWVEADTNISGGEALIRQFVRGKAFFSEELGVHCELLWLPDVFGYSGALPQIMRGCGIKYFATAKIFWNYQGGETFPHNTFTWEGIDGSEVLAHMCNDYNSQAGPAAAIARWNERVQSDGITSRLFPFGWGDGGGGPTRDHAEFLRRMHDLEGVPKTRVASPIDYFRDCESDGVPGVRYLGELYYQGHRGTYTSQARTKRGNRKCELVLREAEMWAAVAGRLAAYKVPRSALAEAWTTVLLNQFHDILPGSSIARVYEEAEAGYADVLAVAGRVAAEAQAALTAQDDGLTVLNSLSWERTELVSLPGGVTGACDGPGTPLPVQTVEGRCFAEVTVPGCSWVTVRTGPAVRAIEGGATAEEGSLENELLRAEFNEFGEMTSLYDKESGRELAAGNCNAFRMYKDVPSRFDAWDIESMYPLSRVELNDPATIEIVSRGPLAAMLRVRRKLNESVMEQDIVVRRNSRRIEFRTVVEWKERHKLLKVAFPTEVRSDDAIHEIQFGHLRRPTHASRPFEADRFEVCNHKWTALAEAGRGFAVLNDCKYGVNVRGGTIALTLLRGPVAPDMQADRGRQEFTYAACFWNGGLGESRVVQEAYELNVPPSVVEGRSGEGAAFSVDNPGIVLETVKPAEDGSADVIVRLYESLGTATRCVFGTSLGCAEVVRTDMLEVAVEALDCVDGRVTLEFRPFEIVTVRLVAEGGAT